MLEHLFTLLFFAAALQGFFLAGVLVLHRRNVHANHILALWVALLSLDLLGQIFYAEQAYRDFPQLIGLTNFFPLCYGGFLYLYVRSLIQSTPFRARDLVHFLGFFVGVLLNLEHFLLSGSEKIHLVDQLSAGIEPWNIQLVGWVIPLYASVYAIYASLLLKRQRQLLGKQAPRLAWLQSLLVLNIVIWLVVWCATALPILLPQTLPESYNELIYLLVCLLIYVTGYFSLLQPEIFSAQKVAGPKYGDNRLPDDLRAQILGAIEQHMLEQQPWRESNLTLPQFADALGLASHQISQVLNDHRGQSFNDYLNQYRVQAVCEGLQQPQHDSLLDLGLSCGFSSKSSFNAIFKKITGLTPSEYRKNVQG